MSEPRATIVDLTYRIHEVQRESDRLYNKHFLGKRWLAEYVANVDVLIDELQRLLQQEWQS